MRELIVKKTAFQKLLKGQKSLYLNDLSEKKGTPFSGEWVKVSDQKGEKVFLGFSNFMVESGPCVRIVDRCPDKIAKDENEVALEYILDQLETSFQKRKTLRNYRDGHRLIFGDSDGLPGLIIDVYENCVLAQINTAGIDRFRKEIAIKLEEFYPEKTFIFWDNQEDRKKECLPQYEIKEKKRDFLIKVKENGFSYSLDADKAQKIGFYYDHRENRKKLEGKLQQFSLRKLENGLDLFCYLGSWGLHLLRGGVKNVDFVDQGDLGPFIKSNLEGNDLKDRGEFYRKDVFSFLEEKISEGKLYDVVVCDPPAFCKSTKNRDKALGGYEKLCRKALKVLAPDSFFVSASCTKNIHFDDLLDIFTKTSREVNREFVILDIGIQGMDHPFSNFKDPSFYLKYLLFFVKGPRP